MAMTPSAGGAFCRHFIEDTPSPALADTFNRSLLT
jgi:hypothetical protein